MTLPDEDISLATGFTAIVCVDCCVCWCRCTGCALFCEIIITSWMVVVSVGVPLTKMLVVPAGPASSLIVPTTVAVVAVDWSDPPSPVPIEMPAPLTVIVDDSNGVNVID